MKFRQKLPAELESFGKKPICFAKLAGQEGWIAAYDGSVVVIRGGESVRHDWSDFEGASWDVEKRAMTFRFVDNRTPALRVVLGEGEKDDVAVVVRERVQRSILVQFHETLPSGAVAHAMVRRDGLEELFTQIIIDGNSGPEDEERLEAIERDLRDTVGIPQIS